MQPDSSDSFLAELGQQEKSCILKLLIKLVLANTINQEPYDKQVIPRSNKKRNDTSRTLHVYCSISF